MFNTFSLATKLRSLILIWAAICLHCTAIAGHLPAVSVTNIRRVFHNGEHNAFTDMTRFDGNTIDI